MYDFESFSQDFNLPRDTYDHFALLGFNDYSDLMIQGRMLYHYSLSGYSNLNQFEKQLVGALLDDGTIPFNDPSFNASGCRRYLNLLRLSDFFIINPDCDRDGIKLSGLVGPNVVLPFCRAESYRSTFSDHYYDIVCNGATKNVPECFYVNVSSFLRFILGSERTKMLEMLYGTRDSDGRYYSTKEVADAFGKSEQDVRDLCSRRSVLKSIKSGNAGLVQDFFKLILSMYDFMNPCDITDGSLRWFAALQGANRDVVLQTFSFMFMIDGCFTLNYRNRPNDYSEQYKALYFVGV